jgi:hypothetical protein
LKQIGSNKKQQTGSVFFVYKISKLVCWLSNSYLSLQPLFERTFSLKKHHLASSQFFRKIVERKIWSGIKSPLIFAVRKKSTALYFLVSAAKICYGSVVKKLKISKINLARMKRPRTFALPITKTGQQKSSFLIR